MPSSSERSAAFSTGSAALPLGVANLGERSRGLAAGSGAANGRTLSYMILLRPSERYQNTHILIALEVCLSTRLRRPAHSPCPDPSHNRLFANSYLLDRAHPILADDQSRCHTVGEMMTRNGMAVDSAMICRLAGSSPPPGRRRNPAHLVMLMKAQDHRHMVHDPGRRDRRDTAMALVVASKDRSLDPVDSFYHSIGRLAAVHIPRDHIGRPDHLEAAAT